MDYLFERFKNIIDGKAANIIASLDQHMLLDINQISSLLYTDQEPFKQFYRYDHGLRYVYSAIITIASTIEVQCAKLADNYDIFELVCQNSNISVHSCESKLYHYDNFINALNSRLESNFSCSFSSISMIDKQYESIRQLCHRAYLLFNDYIYVV